VKSPRCPATSPIGRRAGNFRRHGPVRAHRHAHQQHLHLHRQTVTKPFTQYTEADYAAILGVNVTGFFHITQLAVAEMEKQGSGHVVQITTSLSTTRSPALPAVLASLTKGGLNAATKSLAIEYAKRGIRVNAVALGAIKTPMHPIETYAQLGPAP
jgi:NAD(P)-dependent dehydrogenase (short-subunit alcohol dehydrogenase family)